jgi:hypothetical protein
MRDGDHHKPPSTDARTRTAVLRHRLCRRHAVEDPARGRASPNVSTTDGFVFRVIRGQKASALLRARGGMLSLGSLMYLKKENEMIAGEPDDIQLTSKCKFNQLIPP